MSFLLSWKTQLKIYFIAVILALLLDNQITLMSEDIMDIVFVISNSKYILFIYLLLIAIIMIPLTLLHEVLHGIGYVILRGKVKFGFKGIYAYCQETSGIELTRKKFLFVLLLPLVTISFLCMCLPLKIGRCFYILNLLGSSGDIYMAFWLFRLKDNMKIIDREYGFDVNLQKGELS